MSLSFLTMYTKTVFSRLKGNNREFELYICTLVKELFFTFY